MWKIICTFNQYLRMDRFFNAIHVTQDSIEKPVWKDICSHHQIEMVLLSINVIAVICQWLLVLWWVKCSFFEKVLCNQIIRNKHEESQHEKPVWKDICSHHQIKMVLLSINVIAVICQWLLVLWWDLSSQASSSTPHRSKEASKMFLLWKSAV